MRTSRREAGPPDRAPRMGEPGWFPDEDAIRRAQFRSTSPARRVLEGIALSRFATRVAAGRRKR